MEGVVEQQRELPHDLIAQNILTRLSIQPLVRCKSVSKQWYSTISSHQFAHAHATFPRPSQSKSLLFQSSKISLVSVIEMMTLTRSTSRLTLILLIRRLVLVGSRNGLVCLGSTIGSMFIIWNPTTRKFREFRDDSEICNSSVKTFSIWGFDYVSAIDDYKVVRLSTQLAPESHPFMRVDVFSLRLRKWRRIVEDSCPPNFFSSWNNQLFGQGILVDEMLYWFDGTASKLDGKFSFDLRLELFDTLPELDVSSESGWAMGGNDEYNNDMFFCVIKGCLSKYGESLSGDGAITILKRDGATERIHVPDVLIAPPTQVYEMYCSDMIGFTGSDEIFTMYVDWDVTNIGIMDLSSRPMKHTDLVILEGTSNASRFVDYSPSLISPDAVTSEPESNI